MSWEKRRGRGAYYTRTRRLGGRLVRQYVGGGQAGELAAAEDLRKRAERGALARARRAEQDGLRAAEGLLVRLRNLTDVVTAAVLAANGFTKHGGEWRRGRNDDGH